MVVPDDPELGLLASRLPAEADLEQGLQVAEALSREWRLKLECILAGATNCLVIGGRDMAGTETVLRVPLCEEERGPGYHAQIALSGTGGVEILRHDDATGSTLMPWLRPGTELADLDLEIESEVEICCRVIRKMEHRPLPEAVPVERWYEPFLSIRSAEGIPDDLLQEAQRFASELLETTTVKRLLHGDLHHYNLLLNGSDWTAIDPKGIVAEPSFEPAAFLRNPTHSIRPTPQLMSRRIEAFARGLELPAERIWKWGVAQNTLSVWWTRAERRGADPLRCVEAIRAAKPSK